MRLISGDFPCIVLFSAAPRWVLIRLRQSHFSPLGIPMSNSSSVITKHRSSWHKGICHHLFIVRCDRWCVPA